MHKNPQTGQVVSYENLQLFGNNNTSNFLNVSGLSFRCGPDP